MFKAPKNVSTLICGIFRPFVFYSINFWAMKTPDPQAPALSAFLVETDEITENKREP
jgi:hypothetical protein